jgi:Fe-S-cluster containining protein
MKLVTDIDRIKVLSRQKEEENLGFRSFLKSGGIPAKKIDAIVHRLNNLVSSRVDCRACANCCSEVKPLLKEKDIVNIAAALNMTANAFKKQYLVNAEETGRYHFNTVPCPFLENNRCTIYNSRPDDCRSYPHLHKNNFLSRSMTFVQNCSVCPIVFNVYEHLKSEIQAMDESDDFY